MENILLFIENHYLIFVIGAGVLIFALIGYLAEANSKKDIVIKNPKVKEEVLDTLAPDPNKTVLNEAVTANVKKQNTNTEKKEETLDK